MIDLENGDKNELIYYGNHLYHHDVPILMTDDEILESYKRNKKELEKYTNYRDLFAFPFGQPNSCFSENQVDLILNNGATKVFRSSGNINIDSSSSYLDRLSLTPGQKTPIQIWGNLFKRRIMTCFRS